MKSTIAAAVIWASFAGYAQADCLMSGALDHAARQSTERGGRPSLAGGCAIEHRPNDDQEHREALRRAYEQDPEPSPYGTYQPVEGH